MRRPSHPPPEAETVEGSLDKDLDGEKIAYQDVLGVWNGSDDSCSDHELLPGLGEVDDVNSFDISFVNVWQQQV
jgi:hypothetical protein